MVKINGEEKALAGQNLLAYLQEAGFEPLPTWQDALSRYLKEVEE